MMRVGKYIFLVGDRKRLPTNSAFVIAKGALAPASQVGTQIRLILSPSPIQCFEAI